MTELHPALVELTPEQCRNCRPIVNFTRTLSGMIIDGSITAEQAAAAMIREVNPSCAGPKDEDELDGMCSKPNCAWDGDGTHFVKLNRTLVSEGLPAIEDHMAPSVPADIKVRLANIVGVQCELPSSSTETA